MLKEIHFRPLARLRFEWNKTLQYSYATSLTLHKGFGDSVSDPRTYGRLIRRLIYLTYSRPEISYDVSKLCQLIAPTDEHVLAGLHVLTYLNGSLGNGLFFSSSSTLTLKGFSDFDWGVCPDTKKSTTWFCFSLRELFDQLEK